MPRKPGSRNADYDLERGAMLSRISKAVDQGVLPDSMRALADAAGVSVTTLRHYFGDRAGVLQAMMENTRAEAAPYLAMASRLIPGDVRASLLHFLGAMHQAWFRHGVGKRYASTLMVGLGGGALGPSFVSHVLEPLLQTCEALLQQHVDRGELHIRDVRAAALMLMSPVVLAHLHQDSLGGSSCRPLDLKSLLELQVDTFLIAHGRASARRGGVPASGRRVPTAR